MDPLQILKMVIAMNCLICAGVAQRIHCHGPQEERDCPDWSNLGQSSDLAIKLYATRRHRVSLRYGKFSGV